jgi:hypothetical protein
MPAVSAAAIPRVGVTISDDRMAASIVLSPEARALPLGLTEIVEALQAAGVLMDDEVRARAEALVTLAAGDDPPASFIVAEGTPPQGRSETFVWNPELKAAAVDWLADVPINFYTLNSIITVEKDFPIGTISPLVPSKDGRDVLGAVIPAKHVPVPLQLDHTVRRADDDPTTIIANVAGKVIEDGHTLRIDETLVIKGDVGFETGNINSRVSVHIGGGVPDRFEAKSRGAIAVGMSIEAAHISAGGDVTVSRGIVGRGVGVVTAGGCVTFKFCNEAHIVAGGDVKVGRQAMNSRLFIAGNLDAGGASLVGGTVLVRGHVTLAHIGSQSNVPTRIVVGADPLVVRDIASIELRIQRVTKLLDPIRQILASFRNSKQPLSAAQDQRARSLLARAEEATRKIDADRSRAAKLLERAYTHAPSSVTVSGTIHAGTVIRVADRETVFHKDVKGPLLIEKRKVDRVTELVAVNKLTASIKILTHRKKTPIELLEGLDLEQDATTA